MNEYTHKTRDSNKQPGSKKHEQSRGARSSRGRVVNNRPEAGLQRQIQEMVNNSRRVGQLATMQSSLNGESRQHQPVQRKITGGDTKIRFGTLGDILNGLTDIDLVSGGHGSDLHIEFADLEKGEIGLTTVYAGKEQINPHTDITPAAVIGTHYTIKIQLDNTKLMKGGSPNIAGQLYETIIHEWELHGREHVRNIVTARSGEEPTGRIDHVAHFSPGPTDIDAQIARRIREEKNEKVQQQLFDAYMRDVFAHIYHPLHPPK